MRRDTGMPSRVIRFSAAQPTLASVFWAGRVRARRPRPMMVLSRVHQMDWADRTEGRGNAGKTANSFFHPSGPSEFGYLIQCKSLILRSKLARGASRTPFHPVNPGL